MSDPCRIICVLILHERYVTIFQDRTGAPVMPAERKRFALPLSLTRVIPVHGPGKNLHGSQRAPGDEQLKEGVKYEMR